MRTTRNPDPFYGDQLVHPTYYAGPLSGRRPALHPRHRPNR